MDSQNGRAKLVYRPGIERGIGGQSINNNAMREKGDLTDSPRQCQRHQSKAN